MNSTDKEKRERYVKHLYKKLQREGQLERDVDRLVRNDRIAWGSSMIACKDADAMVTGNIRHYAASIEKLKKVVDARPGEEIFGMTMIVSKGKTILVADTNVTELPSAERLINISKSCVRIARLFGFEPKVAILSQSTFGKPLSLGGISSETFNCNRIFSKSSLLLSSEISPSELENFPLISAQPTIIIIQIIIPSMIILFQNLNFLLIP